MAERVCAAIIRDDAILMVRHVHDGRDYWTLPSGDVEPGETAKAAAVREVWEETCVTAKAIRLLYERKYQSQPGQHVTERCFLLKLVGNQEAVLGHDPELDADSQMLKELAWRSLDHVHDDLQVSKVLAALEDHEHTLPSLGTLQQPCAR
ncbi:MAG TPA: NUDIX hydrolase [Chloroflexota bacterium]|nr:NUDIX hydrolase [Chloroflexota bacterium]